MDNQSSYTRQERERVQAQHGALYHSSMANRKQQHLTPAFIPLTVISTHMPMTPRIYSHITITYFLHTSRSWHYLHTKHTHRINHPFSTVLPRAFPASGSYSLPSISEDTLGICRMIRHFVIKFFTPQPNTLHITTRKTKQQWPGEIISK